jgi:hypothetical protein
VELGFWFTRKTDLSLQMAGGVDNSIPNYESSWGFFLQSKIGKMSETFFH